MLVPEATTPVVQTTRGQALPMYVVYESSFQGVSDSPIIAGQASISSAPFLHLGRDAGEFRPPWRACGGGAAEGPGLVCRRHDKRGGEGREGLALFLGKGRHRASIWQDGSGPRDLVQEIRSVGAGDVVELKLAPSGGAVVRISPGG